MLQRFIYHASTTHLKIGKLDAHFKQGLKKVNGSVQKGFNSLSDMIYTTNFIAVIIAILS